MNRGILAALAGLLFVVGWLAWGQLWRAGAEPTPGEAASAIELVLEGLHLSKRLNKDSVGARAQYRPR